MSTRKKGMLTVAFIASVLFIGIFVFLKPWNTYPFGMRNYHSESICVLSENGKVIRSKKKEEERSPASLAKIVTAMVALENIDNLEKKVPIDVDTYKEMVKKNASMAGFYGREYVTYEDLLYGLLLKSGGECANTLAIQTYGDISAFVEAMNEKVQSIGCKKTHFMNPEGMDVAGQYTTAEDMSLILQNALKNEEFRTIFTSKNYTSISSLDHPQGVYMESTVLSSIEDGEISEGEILGGKSGTTLEAGLCWATLLKKEGKEYICVTMGAPLEDIKNYEMLQKEDTIKILKKL